MQVISTTEPLRGQITEWRVTGDHIALVPTMGNLHAGHLSLVDLASRHAERVVVSIFVNPMQFGAGEDYADYPRTLDRDERRLKKTKTDLVFVPDVDTMYPFGVDNATSVTVPVLTQELCGSFRPGHFDGVTTVVSRLISLVQPDIVVFGEKDYQQLTIIQRLVADLSLPIEVLSGATVREEGGLALSSRNRYLSDKERKIAPKLFATLQEIGSKLESGKRNYAQLEKSAVSKLNKAGFNTDYVSIRRAETLEAPDRDNDELIILAAANLGEARLIDNLRVRV